MFRVRFRAPQFEFEVESSERDFVDETCKQLFEQGATQNSALRADAGDPKPMAPAGASSTKELSIAEFLRQVGAGSGPDHAVAVGYFLEKHRGQAAFAAADIKDGFIKAKFHHSNPSDAIAKARAQGRLMDAAEKNMYVVTQSGEEWVEGQLTAVRAR
jgi:hypothetical protein